jgi:hypothetical protein
LKFIESTTTRKAGGLDFTAIGGKRQGREVRQSLKARRFGKPNQAGIYSKSVNLEFARYKDLE